MSDEITELTALNTQLQNHVEEQAAYINDLESRVRYCETYHSWHGPSWQATIDQLKAEIQTLLVKLEEKEAIIATLEDEIEQLKIRVAETEATVEEQD